MYCTVEEKVYDGSFCELKDQHILMIGHTCYTLAVAFRQCEFFGAISGKVLLKKIFHIDCRKMVSFECEVIGGHLDCLLA